MVLHDTYAIHRRWWASVLGDEWVPGNGDRDWTEWDYILADVLQVITDFTAENGQWMPDDASGDVWWDVKSRFSGYDEAIERERDKREMKPGESLYAVPVYDESKPLPTLRSMMSDIESGTDDRRPSNKSGSRPPTAAELEALRSTTGAASAVE